MSTLVIDASTKTCYAALIIGEERVVASSGEIAERATLTVLQDVLDRAAHTIDAVNDVIVGIGPGRFTGLRVSAATAQSIAFACGIPASGAPSHAMWIPEQPGFFGVVDQAGSAAYALSIWQRMENASLKRVKAAERVPKGQLAESLRVETATYPDLRWRTTHLELEEDLNACGHHPQTAQPDLSNLWAWQKTQPPGQKLPAKPMYLQQVAAKPPARPLRI